jgi:hypothetical protein
VIEISLLVRDFLLFPLKVQELLSNGGAEEEMVAFRLIFVEEAVTDVSRPTFVQKLEKTIAFRLLFLDAEEEKVIVSYLSFRVSEKEVVLVGFEQLSVEEEEFLFEVFRLLSMVISILVDL